MSELIDHLKQVLQSLDRPLIQENECWNSTEDLQSDIEHVRLILQQAGIRKGDRVLLGLPNSYRFIAIYFAILSAGAVAVPINPRMPVSELQTFLRRCCPAGGFLTEKQSAGLIEPYTSQKILTARLILKESKLNYLKWKHRDRTEQRLLTESPEPLENDPAVLLYTSGTTGRPKAVGLSHGQIYAAAQNIIWAHRLTSKDIVYSFLPLFHINAQVVGLISPCLSGGKLIIAPKFSASRFWNVVNGQHVTWVSAVPAVLSILLHTGAPDHISSGLRFVRSASAPLPLLHAQQFEKKFGVPVIESYGMTEAASQICVNPLPPEKRVLGSVGLPVGLSLQIVDEQDHVLPSRETGEIVICGKNVITHYVAADNQDDFRNGWFHTGDIGYVNEEGYVFIIGRKKELINRGGEKISPYEVEEAIRQLPEVKQVAVIGLQDPLYGEKVVAYAVPGPGRATEHLAEKILDHCRQTLSDYKCPAGVEIVDRIPTGPTGKIQRSLLKKQIIAGRETIQEKSL